MSASQDRARKIYNEGHAEREDGRVNAGMPASWTGARWPACPRERALKAGRGAGSAGAAERSGPR